MQLSHSDGSRIDDIGQWTVAKLDILEKYARLYSIVLNGTSYRYMYVDAFAGPGRYRSKDSGELIVGSTLRALEITPPFHEYHFIDLNDSRIKRLQDEAGDRPDVFLYTGDGNEIIVNEILPRIRYEDYRRGLVLLDPYNIDLDYRMIQALGAARSIEVFVNFMIMDVNRNCALVREGRAAPKDVARLNRAWGSDEWQELFYRRSYNVDLFGEPVAGRKSITPDAIAEAYRERLRAAGFKYVPQPVAMRNSAGAPLYYLYFASNHAKGNEIGSAVLRQFRAQKSRN